jgi:hypothetical protein
MVDHRLKQSQALSLQAGDQLRWSIAQVIRFWSLFYRGDWGALEHTAQGLLSRAQSSGNIQQEIWALRCKSLCALHADRPREAIEVLRLITSAMLGSADLAAYVSSNGSLALALARIGSNEASLQAVDETLRMLRGMRYSQVFPVGRPQYGLWAGVAYWLEGQKDQALLTWNRALSAAQQLSLRQDEAMIAAEIRRRQDRP